MKKTILACIFILTGFFNISGSGKLPGGEGVKVVVIDAGHGGKDPGNLGTQRYKTTEKDIALSVALQLGAYLEQHLTGVKVVYTRKTDIFIPLKERAEIANKAKGDLFISIHCDSYTSSAVHGATSLILGRNHDDENRVALRENSAILLEDNYEERYEGFDPRKPESLIALNLYQNSYLNQSVLLAKKIQDQFRERVNRRDRGVKQQPLYVTSRTAMPAVLVELGFLTNPVEEDFLNSEHGQAYLASAIFRAVRDYKEEQDQILGTRNSSEPAESTQTKPAPIQQELKPAEQKELPIAENQKPEVEQAHAEDDQSKLQFAVQILTSASRKNTAAENFNGLEGVKILEENGLYKYYVGGVASYEAADNLRQQVKNFGFNDAFVIGIYQGKKISATEARKMLR